MLHIRRIEIKNFRQYKDIDLSFDDKNGIFLFIGKNGMGKSNFLNAICWCLYNKQPFKFHDKDKKILNERASAGNRWDETSVSIEVSMGDRNFVFKRSYRETQDSVLTVLAKHGEDWKPVPNPTIVINSFLPESVSKFFLFDGEAVQNLYKGDYSKNLEAGVRAVSNVDLLERALDNVKKTMEDLRRSVSKDDPSSQTLEVRLEELTQIAQELESSIEKKSSSVNELKDGKDKLAATLRKYDKYKEIQEKKDLLELDIKDAKTRLEEYQRQTNDLIITKGPFWIIRETLVDVSKKINEENSKGQLPPKIKGTFIKELIENGACICGREITKDHSEYKHLLSLLDSMEILDNRSFLLEDKPEINALLKDLQRDFFKNMERLREQKSKERQRIENQQLKLKEVSQSLVNAPDKDVGNLELTIQKYERQINQELQEIGELKAKIATNQQAIKEVSETLEAINKTNDKRKLEHLKFEFMQEAYDHIDYIKSRIVDQTRQSVSYNTDKYFKQLIWKKDDFESVKFTDDYKVEVYKRGEDINSVEILSTGEMKVLSFATIKALAELSGFSDVPVFLDGPLENLDMEVRESFLNLLPDFTPDKQVFIFSLDYELMENFGKHHVPTENFFRLTRNQSSTDTKIVRAD